MLHEEQGGDKKQFYIKGFFGRCRTRDKLMKNISVVSVRSSSMFWSFP